MKRLTLIRHAKSDWDDPALADHDRPLNGRGRRAAPAVGAALAERGWAPDLILSSTAVRAATTARAIAESAGVAGDRIAFHRELYLASVSTLGRSVAGVDDEAGIGHVALVGHNPGMEDFLDHLSGGSPAPRFVTCAVAEFQLDITYWGEVGAGCAELVGFFTPHDLP